MAKRSSRRVTLLRDELRSLIDADGRSRYEICRAADIDQASMSRFMAEKQDLSLGAAERLATVLGLTLVRKA